MKHFITTIIIFLNFGFVSIAQNICPEIATIKIVNGQGKELTDCSIPQNGYFLVQLTNIPNEEAHLFDIRLKTHILEEIAISFGSYPFTTYPNENYIITESTCICSNITTLVIRFEFDKTIVQDLFPATHPGGEFSLLPRLLYNNTYRIPNYAISACPLISNPSISKSVVLEGHFCANNQNGDRNSNKNLRTEYINIFPNPVLTTLNFDSSQEFGSFEIYDLIGSLVLKNPLKGYIIDLSDLKKGIYIIKFTANNSSDFKIQKFIKQ